MPKKKVIVLTSVHRWDDTRIYLKQIQSIKEITPVIYYAPAKFKKRIIGNVEIRGLKIWKKKIDRIKNISSIIKIFKHHNKDIIHFHDPEIIPFALLAKYLYGTTIIIDIHENNEDDIRNKDWLPRPVAFLLAFIYRYIFKLVLKHFDAIIIAVDHFKEKFNVKYHHKVISIRNYPRLELFNNIKIKNNIENKRIDLRLGYAGVIREERGLSIMCKIVKYFDDLGFATVLDLVGNIPFGESDEIIKNIKQHLSNKSDIVYHGLLPYQEAMKVILNIDIGLVLYMPSYNNINSNPNKLFELMALHKPILASDFPIWKSILENSKGGITVDPENFQDITTALGNMINNRSKLVEMGENGYKAVKSKYNWFIEEKTLHKLLNNFLNCI